MTKKKIILLIAVISTMLCACSASKDTSTSEAEKFTQATESTELIYVESTEQSLEANASQATSVSTEVAETTTTFEYDSVNHTITIDGVLYTIATDAMDYSGSYLPYWSTYHDMEDIVDCINNSDLLVKGWREGFSDELLEEANNSTMLECFVSEGGKILDYYIINSDAFPGYEVPVVIHYSINGETYYTIWVFYMEKIVVEPQESILYHIADVFHLDNLDRYYAPEGDYYHYMHYKNPSVFEYDLENEIITINGNPYRIAEASSVDDYFPYSQVDGDMKHIMDSINNNDLSDKSWRDDFGGWWLYEEAEKSTLLETFVADGGKILNYYLLNAEDITEFTKMNYKAAIPVVVEYSVAGKKHNIIWVFCWDEAIVHIFQLDNFNSYM